MSRGEHVTRIRVFAFVVAAVLVAAGIVLSIYAHRSKDPTGVPVRIVAYATDNESSGGYLKAGLQGVSVTLTSTVPDSLKSQSPYPVNLSAVNATDNGYEIMLYHGVTGSGGSLSFHLPSTFNDIVSEWRNMTPHGSMVSISLYAEYGYISNGQLYSYYFYDNIPYNPFVPVTDMQFNETISINLSHPNTVVPMNELPSIPMTGPNPFRISPPPCNPGYNIVFWNSSTVTGDYPVGVVYLNNSTTPDEASLALSLQSGVLNYSFNSVTKVPGAIENGNSTIEMSEHASYSTPNATIESTLISAGATNTEEIAFIYIPNTTMHITNYAVYYVWESNGQCYDKFVGYETTIKIAAVNLTSTVLNGAYTNESYWGWSVQNVFRMSPFIQRNIQPGGVIDNMTVLLLQANGYSDASSALQKALNAFSVFQSALGLALDIMDAASIIPEGSEAADLAATISLLNDQIGLEMSVISAFSSISYSTTYKFAYTDYSLTNVKPYSGTGSVFTVTIYQSNYAGELDIGGTYYYVNMPSYFFYVLAKPA